MKKTLLLVALALALLAASMGSINSPVYPMGGPFPTCGPEPLPRCK